MAVGDAHVFPGFLTPVLTQISFQSHRLLFSHASEEVRGENTPERNFASTESEAHNHYVMSPTRSPLSHPCWAGQCLVVFSLCYMYNQTPFSFLTLSQTSRCVYLSAVQVFENTVGKRETSNVSFSNSIFYFLSFFERERARCHFHYI